MGNEHWQRLACVWDERPLELYVDDNDTLVQVPALFASAINHSALMDCTFLTMPQKPGWVQVFRGGREDFCIPISLLKHLRSRSETS